MLGSWITSTSLCSPHSRNLAAGEIDAWLLQRVLAKHIEGTGLCRKREQCGQRAMVDLGKCKELSTPKHLPLLAMRCGPGEVTGAPVMLSPVCQAKKSELHLEGVGVWVCNLYEF